MAEMNPKSNSLTPKQPVDWVDPLIDTANRRFFFLTSASRPFGMVNLSPDTRVGLDAWESGYRYTDEKVHWFSHVHAWQLCGIPIMPTIGEMRGHLGSETYSSQFSHNSEIVKPGYHALTLEDYDIRAELTSTTRVGVHRYTFNRSGRAWILVDLPANIMLPMSDCSVEKNSPKEFCGYVENAATRRRPKPTKIFYFLQCDREVDECVSWDGDDITPLKGIMTGCGFALGYDVKAGDTLQFKVGISYCGIKNARDNILKECRQKDFEDVKTDSLREWNTWLSRIEVEGGTDKQKTKFYTDMFHSLKGRRRVSDASGTYMDMTGETPQVRQIPLDENGIPKYDHHNSDAFWGTAWAFNTLWPIICPDVVNNFCNTLLDMYCNGGLIPRGPSGGNYTFVMTSPTSTTFLVSAWMKGIHTFDIDTAFKGMLKNHAPGGLMSKAGYEHESCKGGGIEFYLDRGYVPQGIEAKALHTHAAATMTLEYAYHDWCLAQLAKLLGDENAYDDLIARSENYKNLWDSESKFFKPRNMDGSFVSDFNPLDSDGWEEGNGYHYRWFVPHNVSALIEMFGSSEHFISELDSQFKKAEEHGFCAPHGKSHDGYMDYGNQPCTYLAHLFNLAGAPWLTQKWVGKVMRAAKSDTTPFGGYGGDEDQGMMGTLNVLMSIGLFSVNGGCNIEPLLELSSPIFDKITIHLDPKYHEGKTFIIETSGNGPGERYIQSAEIDGVPISTPSISYTDLAKGGKLKIDLDTKPNKEWGKEPLVS